MDPLPLALEAAPKALVYVGVLLAVGTCAARLLFHRRSFSNQPVDVAFNVDRAFTDLVLTAASIVVMGLLFRAWGHTAASFGIVEAFGWPSLRLIAWESDWGVGWQRQFAGAVALCVFAWSTTQWADAAWPLANLGAVAMCYLLPLTGHAAGEPGPVLLHGTHMLAGGLWLGTLTASVLVTRAADDTSTHAVRSGAEPPLLRIQMLGQFSPLALIAAGLVLATGLFALWLYLGGIQNLISTAYGWALLLKMIFVGDVATFGFLNWKSIHRAPGPEAARVRTALLAGEIAMAGAVVAVTAVLTEVGHP